MNARELAECIRTIHGSWDEESYAQSQAARERHWAWINGLPRELGNEVWRLSLDLSEKILAAHAGEILRREDLL